jgi:dephospho-CoA kinase
VNSGAADLPNAAPRRIPIIGIVGGIGSGKSAVANWVAEHARVSVLDADKLGHQALQNPDVKQALSRRFGNAICAADGTIERSALAREVFGSDACHAQARHDLETIVHPEIGRQVAEGVALAAAQGQDAVLLDAAILLEAGWRMKCDLVVFIDTPDDVRLERVRSARGWSENELRRRESSQWSLTEKRRESDLIVVNDRDLEDAGTQLLESLKQLGVIH